MGFQLSGLFQGHNRTDRPGRAQTAGSTAQARPSGGEPALKAGQTISGEVIAKNGSEVQLRLDQDTVMTARLERDLNLALGQYMTFEVKSATSAQIALTPLFENMSQDPNLTKALDAASLPVTDKTLSMVSGLMEEGMPIDKATLQSVSRDMAAFPGAELRDVLALHKLNLPVTEENLNQMSNYRNMEYRLLEGIETIAGQISGDVLQMAGQPGGESAAAKLFFDLWNVFDGGSGETTPALGTQGGVREALSGEADAVQAGGDAASGSIVSDKTIQTDVLTSGSSAEQAGSATQPLTAEGKIIVSEDGFLTPQPPGGEGARGADKTAGWETEAGGRGTAVFETSAMQETEAAAPQSLAGILSKDELSQLSETLKSLGLSERAASEVSRGTMTPDELMKLIGQAVLSGGITKQGFKSLASHKSIRHLFRDRIEQSFLLKPEQVADKKEVEQMYERLREQTGKLSRLLADAGRGDAALAKSVNGLRENVDFINQLNQALSYVQIPLKLAGRNAHGDLYVYTKKKNLAGKDGNVSALLHLDMEHMGTVDVYVTLNREKVATKFYLQREEMLDFVEKNLYLLNDRLLKRGYTMNAEVLYREKPAKIAEEMTKQEGGASLMSKFSFDVRA